jgi:uncharacterized protein (TIGR03905 family)
MKHIEYKTFGTCSQMIIVDIDDQQRIDNVQFIGGCNSNTKGIASLVKGMKVEDVKARLKGITCGSKPTSCPDQLVHALEQAEQ